MWKERGEAAQAHAQRTQRGREATLSYCVLATAIVQI